MTAKRYRPTWSFSLGETVMIAVLIGFAVWLTARGAPVDVIHPEVKYFQAAYGPERHSNNAEEWLIRDFFSDRRGGFFVDVGANHFRENSNTYFLETKLGWSGIAVEPLSQFQPDYAAHRPRTRFFPFFVSDESHAEAKVFLVEWNHLVTSARKDFAQRWDDEVQEVLAPTITLDDLLDSEGVTSFDFLSMDIELWEPRALAGFDVERFQPALVCVEAHPEVRQQILNYFAGHRYVLVGSYLRADMMNLYFAPLASLGDVSAPRSAAVVTPDRTPAE